jgi:hypothetical protein
MGNPFSWRLIAEKGKQIFKIAKRQQAWAKLRGIVTPCYSSKYLVGLLKQYLVRDNLPLTLQDTLTQALELYIRTSFLIRQYSSFMFWANYLF